MVPVRLVPLGASRLVNRTVTVHEAPGARSAPVQVFVPAMMLNAYWRLAGETATAVTWVDVPPVAEAFVRVTTPTPVIFPAPVGSVIVSGLGETETVALAVTPVAVRVTEAGVTASLVELAVSVRLYGVSVARPLGAVKITPTVHDAPGASVPVVVHVPPAAPAGLEKG